MSHLTYINPRFQKFPYLAKALTKLNIVQSSDSALSQANLVISQPNGTRIEFCWNVK